MRKKLSREQKDKPQNCEKIFAKYLFDKGLISKIQRILKTQQSKNEQSNFKKMGRRCEQTPHQGRYTDGKQHTKILNITQHSGTANKKNDETPLDTFLERITQKTLTTPNAEEGVEKQELSLIASASAKWCRHFGKQLAVSYKTKHTLMIQSSNQVPWYLPKRVENLGLHKTCTGIFTVASFITAKI